MKFKLNLIVLQIIETSLISKIVTKDNIELVINNKLSWKHGPGKFFYNKKIYKRLVIREQKNSKYESCFLSKVDFECTLYAT